MRSAQNHDIRAIQAWTLIGAMALFSAFALLLVRSSLDIIPSEPAWYIGMGIAFSLGIAALILACQEFIHLYHANSQDLLARQHALTQENKKLFEEKNSLSSHHKNLKVEQLSLFENHQRLTTEYNRSLSQLAELNFGVQALKDKTERQKATIDNLSNLLAQKEAELIPPPPPPEPEKPKDHYHAMYLQLRQQFDEKSKILDDTRRELFHCQEKLNVVTRELDELLIHGESETEAKLIQHILELDQELELLDQERTLSSLGSLLQRDH